MKKGNNQAPILIDAGGHSKAVRAIRTATYADKKDIKHYDSSATLQNQPSVDALIHLEEGKISQKRLQQVRSANKFITAEPVENLKKSEAGNDPNTIVRPTYRTMSVYGNKNRNLEINERPFTAILQTDMLKYGRNNDLREIDNIKKRLNKYDVTN